MSKHRLPKPAAPVASGKPKPATQQRVQEQANQIYTHSTDLEVLLRYKVYKKTPEAIDKIQLSLNEVREHVHNNLKSKDRPRHWQGLQRGNSLGAFLFGILLGVFLGLWLAHLPPSAPPHKQSKKQRPPVDNPIPSR